MTGFAFNYYSTSTYMTKEGKRLCSIDFDYISDFSEGYARVVKKGYGYGFIDANMNFKIPMQYEYAEDFVNGYAKIKQNDNWYLIDSDNKKIEFKSKIDNKKYQEIAEYYEGMCRVSTLKPNLAYHSDYDEIAGIWGFINEKGEEVIAPQYIYAYDFKEGIAIVCKGKWTIDKKWDNNACKYLAFEGDNVSYFKGFITCVENSNTGYKWDWDETKLAGKKICGVFQYEEYENQEGKHGVKVRLNKFRSLDKITPAIPAGAGMPDNRSAVPHDWLLPHWSISVRISCWWHWLRCPR